MPLIKGKSQKSFVKNLKEEIHAGKPMKQSLAIAYSMKRKAEKKKMADGGSVTPPAPSLPGAQSAQDSMRKAFKFSEGGEVHSCPSCGYADGGFIGSHQSSGKPEVDKDFAHEPAENASGFMSHEGDHKRPNSMAMSEDSRKLNQHGEVEQGEEEGGQGFHGESYMGHQNDPHDEYQSTAHDEDMVGRIMKQKQMSYSKGGQIANSDMYNQTKYDEPNEFDDLVLRNDDMEDADYTGANSGDELDNPGEDARRSDIISRIMKSRRKKDRLPSPA